MKFSARAVLLAAGLAAGALGGGACGKRLVAGDTYDHPLVTPYHGSVFPGGGLTDAVNPMVSLLWTDPLQNKPDVPMPAHWLSAPVDRATDEFTIQLFRPPPPEALVELVSPDGSESAQIAVAEIVVIDDRDGDGTFRVTGPHAQIVGPDRYLAGSVVMLTYVARPFPSGASTPLTLATQTSGYALVNFVCQGRVAGAPTGTSTRAMTLTLKPSDTLPEVRTCRRTHSP